LSAGLCSDSLGEGQVKDPCLDLGKGRDPGTGKRHKGKPGKGMRKRKGGKKGGNFGVTL